MVIHCAICGKEVSMYKGRAKYCPNCRGEIERLKGTFAGFKECAEYLAFVHAEERRLNMAKSKSIEEVKELAEENNLSYGYMVAKLEGRI